MALDKDIIKPGNKIYSPDTCCFVSREINNLLNDRAALRGEFPQGVYFEKRRGNFRASISIQSKVTFLGYYANPEAAHQVYLKAKVEYILILANEQSNPRVKKGLMLHAAIFEYMLTTMSQSNIMPS